MILQNTLLKDRRRSTDLLQHHTPIESQFGATSFTDKLSSSFSFLTRSRV